MKSFQVACVLLVAVIAVASAEPPRYRSRVFRFQRQEQEPVEEGSGAEGPYPAAMPAAPYPPSNWKPTGQRLELPAQQQPQDVYGPPPTPTNVYGPPPTPTTTAAPEETTTAAPEEEVEVTEEAVTTEPLSETVDVEEEDKAQEQEQGPKSEKLTQAPSPAGPGFYYVQLPQLQTAQVQQQYYVAPQQYQSAQLKALPVAAAQPLAQPLVYASQPVVYSSAYYVQNQAW